MTPSLRLKVALAAAVFALPAGGALAQDVNAQPTYGALKLAAGTLGSPHMVQLTSGGTISAWDIGTGNCRGYIASAPDYQVRYTAGSTPLIIDVAAESDTTLVALAPDGTWHCDDDSGEGLNPQLNFAYPASGNYLLWVGTYGQGNQGPATLSISEQSANTVDPNAQPLYGSMSLTSGSLAAPHAVQMTAGGAVDAWAIGSGNCRGYVGMAPDYAVQFSGGGAFTIGAQSDIDTTLVVLGPDGTWNCDDDSGGSLNPQLTFGTALNGTYRIWVGTYSANNNASATLTIAQSGAQGGAGGGLTPDAQPVYGSTALSGGFLPDPYTVGLNAGGDIYATDAAAAMCRGYVTSAPSYVLNYTRSGSLPLIISAGSERDTTLVVRGPDGAWQCDDDSGEGLNSALTLTNPMSGTYAIWVGTYSSGTSAPATLQISELYSQ